MLDSKYFILKLQRYGQFTSDAIVDGRLRVISFRLDENNGNVKTIVPHFWDTVGMFKTYLFIICFIDSSN